MIIKTNLAVDRREGTVDLAVAAQHTALGASIAYAGVIRLLVWHTPEPRQFAAVAGVLAPLCDKLKARQLRVAGITPNLFALGLYPVGFELSSNPAAIVLLELDTEGTLLEAEVWSLEEGGRLSKTFDEHKDDIHPEGWLESIGANWVRQELTLAEFFKYSQRKEQQRPTAPPKADPLHSAARENRKKGNGHHRTQAKREPPVPIKGSRRERAAINKQLRA